MTEFDAQTERSRMVDSQIAERGVRDPRVLEAMRKLPRERFLPPSQARYAYEDRALPIGMEQTLSQPYIVALMTESLRVAPDHRVLEIGTGTGYQTAVLATLARHVYSVERLDALSIAAEKRLEDIGLQNVTLRIGDGSLGWPEHAPFDRIIVTAAAPAICQALVDQLAEGGRLVLPVGEGVSQQLTTIERRHGSIIERPSIAVRFVKLIGEQGFPPN